MRLLVTGLGGLLGVNLALQVRDRHEVQGTVHHQGVDIEGVRAHRVDLTDPAATDEALRQARPDAVIHTAGLTNVEECERRPADAMRHNADASTNVARASRRAGARLIHLSTDHLFDGTSPFVVETQPPAPLNAYARSKLAAETNVLREHPEATIVRTNFYGWGSRRRQSLSDWIVAALRKREGIGLFFDVHFTPIQINDLVDVLMELLPRRAAGVYNVAGRERLSKHEFGLRIAKAFGLPETPILAVSIDDMNLEARRPRDLSLATQKIEALLGRPMPDVAEGLRRLVGVERDGLCERIAQATRVRTPVPN